MLWCFLTVTSQNMSDASQEYLWHWNIKGCLFTILLVVTEKYLSSDLKAMKSFGYRLKCSRPFKIGTISVRSSFCPLKFLSQYFSPLKLIVRGWLHNGKEGGVFLGGLL